MKTSFKDWIYVKHNSLSKDFCKHVIDKFENDPDRSAGCVDQNNPRVNEAVKITTETGITVSDSWKDEDKVLYDSLQLAVREYNDYLRPLLRHPDCQVFNGYKTQDCGYKVQKYEPDGYYHWHHDWSMTDGWSRAYSFIWYLNTIKRKDLGYTEFIDGTKIQPKAGSILFFPATFTYVHRGYKTLVPKYIIPAWIYTRP